MSARWVSLLAWAAVAASAIFWGLRVFVQAPAAPPQARLAARRSASGARRPDAPARRRRRPGRGGAAAAAAADPRYALVGVVSPRDAARGRRGAWR
ncbi:MAG: hypothetical protein KIS83_07025 [Rubrivivax sp.]|nr:hypothetical protein [Rubrivivax sp.]